jgi:GGDEF domain-containing protein
MTDKSPKPGDLPAHHSPKAGAEHINKEIHPKAPQSRSLQHHESAGSKSSHLAINDKSHLKAAVDFLHSLAPTAPKEGYVHKFLHTIKADGQKLIHKGGDFLGKLLPPRHEVHGADKLSPKERAHKNVTDCTDKKTGRSFHYDDGGRIDRVSARNHTEVVVHYAHGSKADKVSDYAIVNAKGEVLSRGESSKNLAITIDQQSGELKSSCHDVLSSRGKQGEIRHHPIAVETHATPEGMVTHLRREFSGKRIDKCAFGPDKSELWRIEYEYHHKKGGHGDGPVTARQYVPDRHDATNFQLKHQFHFESHAAVEKQDPTLRTDFSKTFEDRERAIIKESSNSFDLHKDKEHPFKTNEKITNFKEGKISVTEKNFDGIKEIDSKHVQFDEMARPTSFQYKSAEHKLDVSFAFDERGKPTLAHGAHSDVPASALLNMAELATADLRLTHGIKTLDHAELLAHRGPNGPRDGAQPTGIVAYKDGDNFVQHSVVRGIVYDEQHNKIGTARDNGEVQIGNRSFNISSDSSAAAVFSGVGSDGRYLDLTCGFSKADQVRQEGFNGYITNGTDKLLTVGGHVFGSDHQILGQVGADGKLIFAGHLEQAEKDKTSLSSLLHGQYRFSGNENGKLRQFDLDSMSHGQLSLPALDAKGLPAVPDRNSPTAVQRFEVRLGMLIDTSTNEQVGKFVAPRQNADGSFAEGCVEINGKKHALSELTNAVFKVTVDGQAKEMHGAVIGPRELQADGTQRAHVGGIINLDECLERSKINLDAKNKEFQDAIALKESQQAADGLSSAMPLLAAPLKLYSEGAKVENITFDSKKDAYELANIQYGSDKSSIERILASGQVDSAALYKIQKMSEHIQKADLPPLVRLKGEIDNPGHELEKIEPGSCTNGLIRRPDLNHPGIMHEYDLRDSRVYKKGSDVLVGNFNPVDGTLRLLDERGRLESNHLAEPGLKGTSVHFTVSDSSGASRKIDWVNDGQGRIESLDQLRKQVAKERAYAELAAKGATSGEPLERLERTKILEQRYKKTLDDMAAHGVKDATRAECGFTSLEIVRGGPKEFVRSEHDKPGRHYVGAAIVVPTLGSHDCLKVSGEMRIGHSHFYSDHGQLYKTTYDAATKQWVPHGAPCGKLEPGYRAQIDGKTIDLQTESNFLFKMHLDGESNEHWIMGLGAPQRDASGKLVAGGLIDAKEVVRRGQEARREIDRAAKEYDDNQTWGPLGWAVDRGYFSGRGEQLDQIQQVTQDSQKLLDRQLTQMFCQGLSSNTLATADIEHSVRAMQNRLSEMDISAGDASELSRQGQQVQSNVREGAAMAATTVLTGGVSMAVGAGTLTATQAFGVVAAGGAFSSAAIRQTKGATLTETMANAGGGGFEALIMYGGGNLSWLSKNFRTVGGSTELLELVNNKETLTELQAMARQRGLLSEISNLAKLQGEGRAVNITGGVVANLADHPQAMKLVSLINKGKNAEVNALFEILSDEKAASLLKSAATSGGGKLQALGYAGAVGNAYLQSTGFSLVNASKTDGWHELTRSKLLEGGAYMLLGEAAGAAAQSKAMGEIELERTFRGYKVGQFADGMISATAGGTINNSVFTALNARASAREFERNNIAAELHIDKGLITDEIYEAHKNQSRINAFILDAAIDGAATMALSSPVAHFMTHGAILRPDPAGRHESVPGRSSGLLSTYGESQEGRAISSQARISYDESGRPRRLDEPDGISLVKGETGWDLHYKSNLVRKDVLNNIEVHPDGTVVKEAKALSDGLPVSIIEKPDGSVINTKRGLVSKVVDPKGHEIEVQRDASGAVTKFRLSAGAELIPGRSGWDIVVDGVAEHFCKDVKIDQHGALHNVADNGVIITTHADGSRSIHVPGDPIGPIDYHGELHKFEHNLANIGESMTSAHLRESFLDLQARLAKSPAGKEKESQVLYEINRLLDAPGLVPLERRLLWLDEAINLAANPDYVSQGSSPTCGLAACEQRTYALHPDIPFRIFRQLNEIGEFRAHNGDLIASCIDQQGKFAPAGVDLPEPKLGLAKQSMDGDSFETSRILQSLMKQTIELQRRSDRGSTKCKDLVYTSDLEPMMEKITGRAEKFVVAAPADGKDLVEQLLSIKQQGNLYAILEMNAAHLGANGLNPSGWHARVVKDIHSTLSDSDRMSGESLSERFGPDGLAIKKARALGADGKASYELDSSRINIELGNTWHRSASHEVMSAERAYETTLAAGVDEHVDRLVERINANPSDPREKLTLLSWKIGLLNSALVHDLNGSVDVIAEKALHRLGPPEKLNGAALARELTACEAELIASHIEREEHLNGSKAAKQLRSQIDEILEGSVLAREMDCNLSIAERNYLLSLGDLKRAMSEVEAMEYAIAKRGPHDVRQEHEIASRPLFEGAQINNRLEKALGALDRAGRQADGNAVRDGKTDDPNSAVNNFKRRIEGYQHQEFLRTLLQASGIDPLTGYKNLIGLERHLDKIAEKDQDCYLISLDFRRCKIANDSLGKEATDDMLCYTMRHIEKLCNLKSDELLSRSGGDEAFLVLSGSRDAGEVARLTDELSRFLLLCKHYDAVDANGLTYGMHVAERWKETSISGDNDELGIFLAVGAVARRRGETPRQSMERADTLMNERKIAQEAKKTAHEIPAAFIADYSLPAQAEQNLNSHSHNITAADKYAPRREILAGLEQYDKLTVQQKEELKLARSAEIEKLQGRGGGDLVLLNRLSSELRHYEQLSPGERTRYKVNYALQCERFESLDAKGQERFLQHRAEAASLLLNPHTDAAGAQLCRQVLRRTFAAAEDLVAERLPAGFSIIKADLDNMKLVNDKLGHGMGDQLLQHAGEYLRSRIPRDCFIGSPGGGGVVIIAPNERRRAEVQQILAEYGTRPPSGGAAGLPESLFVPNIELPKASGANGEALNLRFGFSQGCVDFDSTMMQKASEKPKTSVSTASGTKEWIDYQEGRRAERDRVIDEHLKLASAEMDKNKAVREADLIRMPRISQHDKLVAEWEQRKAAGEAEESLGARPQPFKLNKVAVPKTEDYTSWIELIRDRHPLAGSESSSKSDEQGMGTYGLWRTWLRGADEEYRRHRSTYDGMFIGGDVNRTEFMPQQIPNVFRHFARDVQAVLDSWEPISTNISPADRQVELERRVAQLQSAIKPSFEKFGIVVPELKAMSRAQMEGARGEYLKGQGLVCIDEDTLLRKEMFRIDILGHEAMGHQVQDQLAVNVQMLDRLRGEGKSINELIVTDSNGNRTLTVQGKEFCRSVARQDAGSSLAALTQQHLVERMLLSSYDWLTERLIKSRSELLADSDYVSGHRLLDSFIKMNRDEASRLPALINLMLGRNLNHTCTDSELEQIESLIRSENASPYAGFDGRRVFGQMLSLTAEQRMAVFGYDPFSQQLSQAVPVSEGSQPAPRMDSLFLSMLHSPAFFEKHPDFLVDLLKCNTEADPATRIRLKREWLNLIRFENPDHPAPAPNQAIAVARFDLLAYRFAREYFAANKGSRLGNLTEQEFDRQVPQLAFKLICDNAKIAFTGEFAKYLYSVHEQRARLVQDIFKHIMAHGDLEDRPDCDSYSAHDFNNGRVLIANSGKDQMQRIPALRTDAMLAEQQRRAAAELVPEKPATVRKIGLDQTGLFSKDFEDWSEIVRKVHQDQLKQTAGAEPSFDFLQTEGIPEGYMPSAFDQSSGNEHSEGGDLGKAGAQGNGGGSVKSGSQRSRPYDPSARSQSHDTTQSEHREKLKDVRPADINISPDQMPGGQVPAIDYHSRMEALRLRRDRKTQI